MIVFMVSSVLSVPANVFAEEKDVIEVLTATSDSITLKAEDGYVYAVKVKDKESKDPSKFVWKWAEDSYYNKEVEPKSVTFTGLEPDKEYEFACALKATDNPTETGKVKTKVVENESKQTESKQTESESKETEPKEPESKETESKESEPGSSEFFESEPESKESEPPVENKTHLTGVSRELTFGPPTEEPGLRSVTDTTVALVTISTQEYVRVENNNPVGDWIDSGEFSNLNPGTMYQFAARVKASGEVSESVMGPVLTVYTMMPSPAKAPVEKGKNDTTVSLDAGDVSPTISGNSIQYGIYDADGNIQWSDTGIFEGLTPETEYRFVLGEKSVNAEIGSMPGPELLVKTLKAAADAPAGPELESRTDTEIRLKVIQGQEYAMVIPDAVTEWNDTGIFNGLSPSTQYTFITRVKFDSDTVGSKESEPLVVSTKASAAAGPDEPELAGRTETSIVLKTVENQEYGIKLDDGNFAWQVSPEFTGLTSNKEYIFKTRVIYDPEEAMESQASAENMFKTLMPFEGSTITGIASDGSYTSGARLTAAAVGNGMDNVNPSEGDSRWVPRSWNWGQKIFSDWKENYTIPFTVTQEGNYRLTVDFEREEYTSGSWKATGAKNTAVVRFTVTKAPVTEFVVTASAGANGKITPQGNVLVKKDESCEFTFTPNNGYKVAKVYVDGVEVKVQNNKYKFESVTANHSISVTFEQAKKIDSPKTGDSADLTPAIMLMAASALLLIGLFLYSRKRNHE